MLNKVVSWQKVRQILRVMEKDRQLSTSELQMRSTQLQAQVHQGRTLNQVLVEAYALVAVVDEKILGLTPYPVQIAGALALHSGRIAEMKTGEGKTLVETMPAYLNALSKKGVHVITVNEYLAQRDYEEMKPVYEFLGLTVGLSLASMDLEAKQQAYQCDITYVTNSEIGFDYLRDNIALFKSEQVLRGLNYALVDEVDNVFLDDAQTPLILGGKSVEKTPIYNTIDTYVKMLDRQQDVATDLDKDSVYLTDSGRQKMADFLGIDSVANPEYAQYLAYVNTSLRANFIMRRGVDYIVKQGKVLLIDQSTGRVSLNRRFNDGLHQALEAKEGVEIQGENEIVAQITYQNFFNLYHKVAGMTGTALTEKKEFKEVYHLKVVAIPTNKPNIRQDLPDRLFISKKTKQTAIITNIKKVHQQGQPVLVGTNDINESQELGQLLDQEHLTYNILNAETTGVFNQADDAVTQQNAKEAKIVAQAGQRGAITISTNMAGRGTDIKLGPGVADLGGLLVIGDERGINRRVDNQLAGRAGRQGDPGQSIFYISFEDKLIQEYSREKILQNFLNIAEQVEHDQAGEIFNRKLIAAIKEAQKRLEGSRFDQRKETLKFDVADEKQRQVLFQQRQALLDETDNHLLKQIALQEVPQFLQDNRDHLDVLKKDFENLPHYPALLKTEYNAVKEQALLQQFLEQLITTNLDFLNQTKLNLAFKAQILQMIDHFWQHHLQVLSKTRKEVAFSAYKQQENVVDYINRTNLIFSQMITQMKMEIFSSIVNLDITTVQKSLAKADDPEMVQQKHKQQRIQKTII